MSKPGDTTTIRYCNLHNLPFLLPNSVFRWHRKLMRYEYWDTKNKKWEHTELPLHNSYMNVIIAENPERATMTIEEVMRSGVCFNLPSCSSIYRWNKSTRTMEEFDNKKNCWVESSGKFNWFSGELTLCDPPLVWQECSVSDVITRLKNGFRVRFFDPDEDSPLLLSLENNRLCVETEHGQSDLSVMYFGYDILNGKYEYTDCK